MEKYLLLTALTVRENGTRVMKSKQTLLWLDHHSLDPFEFFLTLTSPSARVGNEYTTLLVYP